MVLLRLAAVAGEDVGGDGTVGHQSANSLDATQIPLAVVLAVHAFEHRIATTLHRQVDVSAHIRLLGDDAQGGIAHVLGVRRGKADAHARHGACHGAEQFGEEDEIGVGVGLVLGGADVFRGDGGIACRLFVQGSGGALGFAGGIAARLVGVHVLSQEGHLLETALFEVATLVDDALHIAAAFATAGVGHDAVVAEVVAPAGDAHKTGDFRSAEAFGHHVAVGFGEREVDVDGLLSHFGLCHEVGEGEIGVGTGHKVGVVLGQEVIFDAFGHATEHAQDESASFLAQGVEGFEAMNDFLLGIVAHGAGVEKHGVGFVERFAGFVAGHLHHAGHNFGVGHVHLAAVGFYEEFLHWEMGLC